MVGHVAFHLIQHGNQDLLDNAVGEDALAQAEEDEGWERSLRAEECAAALVAEH